MTREGPRPELFMIDDAVEMYSSFTETVERQEDPPAETREYFPESWLFELYEVKFVFK